MRFIIKEENLKRALWSVFDKIFESLEYGQVNNWEGFYTTKPFNNEEPPQIVLGFNSESSYYEWYCWGLFFNRYQKIFGIEQREFLNYLKYYIEEKYNKKIDYIF